MKASDIKRAIALGSAEITRLWRRVNETFKFRDASSHQYDEWMKACGEFHVRYSELAFPGGYDGAAERILAGDQISIEVALCFLEERPYFFRSGYMLKPLTRKLKQAPLSVAQSERLRRYIQMQALRKNERATKNAA